MIQRVPRSFIVAITAVALIAPALVHAQAAGQNPAADIMLASKPTP